MTWPAPVGLRGTVPGQPILTPDGGLLGTVCLEENGRLLIDRWLGHCTPDNVALGMNRVLAILARHSCVAVLSDGSAATGDWLDLVPWMQYDMLPRLVGTGIRYVANVRSGDPAA